MGNSSYKRAIRHIIKTSGRELTCHWFFLSQFFLTHPRRAFWQATTTLNARWGCCHKAKICTDTGYDFTCKTCILRNVKALPFFPNLGHFLSKYFCIAVSKVFISMRFTIAIHYLPIMSACLHNQEYVKNTPSAISNEGIMMISVIE